MADIPKKSGRRTFLKRAAAATVGTAALGGAGVWLGSVSRVSRAAGKKVIVIGVDGMDPRLSESMMKEGLLPNLARIRAAGGFSALGTSIPPQSPVAWANFINGAGPGAHGIFDFIHRHPHDQCNKPFYSAAETLPGAGGYDRPIPPPGVAPIGSLHQPGKATVEGRVRVVEIRSVERNSVLACEISDSTGDLTALFYGRSRIPGLMCGSRVRLKGPVGIKHGAPVMVNPAYELIVPQSGGKSPAGEE